LDFLIFIVFLFSFLHEVFSIGLYMLNQDGSKMIDGATGLPIPTYTNKDVMNFARGFTNFAHQGRCLNDTAPLVVYHVNQKGSYIELSLQRGAT